MANIVASIDIRGKVIKNAWEWVHDNFHKLSEPNKIKVSLAIISKDMPNKVEGEVNAKVTMMPTVRIDGKPLEVKVGD